MSEVVRKANAAQWASMAEIEACCIFVTPVGLFYGFMLCSCLDSGDFARSGRYREYVCYRHFRYSRLGCMRFVLGLVTVCSG
jgi:hypothetical protein